MTTFQTDNQIIYFNKKFGLITENQIILTRGSEQNKIRFESINRVNLIKRRVFYINSLFLLLSILIFMYVTLFFKSERMEMYYTFLFSGIVLLIYALIHKFYLYKIVIKSKDNSIHELNTTQMNRRCIKEFYNMIVKKVPKQEDI